MALSLIPSSSSSNTPQLKYDMFISFRGEDTRCKFTSHLDKALREKHLIDYELNRGDEISASLLEAIEKSQISVIVFSRDYASSKWCLDELVKILECKEKNEQIVIPVFYEVDPSDVRHQTGSFAIAFAEHEHKVQRWKDALKKTASLAGWDSSTFRLESKLIEAIVQDVLEKTNRLSSPDTSHLVGIDSKIKKIESLLSIGTNNVCTVGIWGIGGIGKTTLAESVFNKISRQFSSSHFCRNVRERCEESNGLHHLQQELLKALSGDGNANIGTCAVGRTFIKNRLGCTKVLIVFDDVPDYEKIEDLIGGFDCLGLQSRIILTTRDKHVLQNGKVDHVYKVGELSDHEALVLFSRFAFRRNHPTEDYMKLSKRVANYARGIPLALKVLGSHLHGREKEVWVSAIDKLETIPPKGIREVLKISYDGLEYEEKNIFLDIAHFFKWSDIELVKAFIEACGFQADIGIDVLIDKSLITKSDNKITMHDLLQAMAREIVRQESIEDPGKRSRLWHHEDIYHILAKNSGTKTIRGISLDMSKIRDIHLNPCAFANMSELRFLNFYNSSLERANKVHVSEAFEIDFSELRYLRWYRCPIKSLLSSFLPENLVILNMSHSKIEQLWNGVQHCAKLKEINLEGSNITICPDLSGFPNLKRLDLNNCEYLHEISFSIEDLKELDFLNLFGCTNLEILPEMPRNLEWLDLSGTAIEELPSSIKDLRRLVNLDLICCNRLKSLPNSVCEWKSLKSLKISSCSMLEELPSDIGTLESLKDLIAKDTAIKELPSSIIDLKNIERLCFNRFGVKGDTAVGWFLPCKVGWHNMAYLDLSYCGITNLPDNLDCLSSVRSLNLGGNSFESIPTSIINLSNLVELHIDNCKKLKYLPALQLEEISAFGCTSLEVLPCLSIFRNINDRYGFVVADFGNCCKLDPNISEEYIVKDALRKIQIYEDDKEVVGRANICYPGSEIPEWFNFRSSGSFIDVELPDWFDYNYVSFVLSVVVAPPCLDHQDGLRRYKIRWNCNLKSKDGDSCVKTGSFNDRIYCQDIRSNHVFVDLKAYISRSELSSYDNKITFQFYIPHVMKQLKVEKCGVHFMFAQCCEEVDGSSWISEDEEEVDGSSWISEGSSWISEDEEEVDGSSWISEDEDVLSLANTHDSYEEEDELIKTIKALCVLNCGMHVYLKEAFLLDSVGYLSVNCLGLASWPDMSSPVSPKYQLANYLCLLWLFCVLHYIHV